MVEFTIILLGKQKCDWDNKAAKKNEVDRGFRTTNSEKQYRCLTGIEKVEPIEDANNVSKTKEEEERLKTVLVLDRFAFLKEMPFTTKLDFTAFGIFNISYAMFIIIHFCNN